MLKYLAYVSRQSHVISDKDLKNLLQKSRNNNTRIGVTGMLIYFQGIFIQYLEGEQENVDWLYSKIAKDKRHQSIIELDSGYSKERAFSDWSMAFKKLQKDEAFEILGYKDLETAQLFENKQNPEEQPALSLLNNYVKNL
ncbi:Sensors of blue-light using FAD [Salegentibacter holothuriorum]|uniref:Sensors of blue-light using FAD n=1 Tax=Salegentibacter holothuriorum TaxID=241145 RepID=A0A1T5D8N5_9FLAO|nr:BLUF domain-containing protein [Salegentibacter holothuriorum]SKB68035.1 Sensors of blue-light using FAD [Salegentibacter holothuriorum]